MYSCLGHAIIWEGIVGKFHVVQIFAFFADKLRSTKIKTATNARGPA